MLGCYQRLEIACQRKEIYWFWFGMQAHRVISESVPPQAFNFNWSLDTLQLASSLRKWQESKLFQDLIQTSSSLHAPQLAFFPALLAGTQAFFGIEELFGQSMQTLRSISHLRKGWSYFALNCCGLLYCYRFFIFRKCLPFRLFFRCFSLKHQLGKNSCQLWFFRNLSGNVSIQQLHCSKVYFFI